MLSGTESWNVKRTGLNAITASDTSSADVFHNSIRRSTESPRRTGGHAGGIIAMEAGGRYGTHAAGREFAGNMTPDVSQLYTWRRIVLQLAGDLTCVAGYARL